MSASFKQFNFSSSSSLRNAFVSAVAKHYTILKCRAELDQLVQGLETLGVLQLIRSNPCMMRQLFTGTGQEQKLTAELLFDLFPPQFSSVGSKRREQEEKIVMLWDNYLQMVQGIYMYIIVVFRDRQ